mgnify:CR=1 FL=1
MALIGAPEPPGPPLDVAGLCFSWPNGRQALMHCSLQIPSPGMWMLVGSSNRYGNHNDTKQNDVLDSKMDGGRTPRGML